MAAQHSKRRLLKLHALKLEVPALLSVSVASIPLLPLSQHEMARCLQPMAAILGHVAREHASMSVCHAVFAQIVAEQALPLPQPLTSKYLDLYAELDEFWSSPVPVLESILRRYIPPYILQRNDDAPRNNLCLSRWSKSDAVVDEAMEPFDDDATAGSGLSVLPRAMYSAMQRLLNRFSSAHALGVCNVFGAAPPDALRARKREVVACAETVWRCMEWDGHEADVASLNAMLDTLCKWDELTSALSLFERVVGARVVEPDRATLYVLADAMVHPRSVAHFVSEVAPGEWAATGESTLARQVAQHLQAQGPGAGDADDAEARRVGQCAAQARRRGAQRALLRLLSAHAVPDGGGAEQAGGADAGARRQCGRVATDTS